MMAILLIILMILAGIHFLYDGIILPGIRQHYRNQLFALRDELRWQMIQGIDNQDIRAFNLVHDSINVFVNRLPLITISMRINFENDLKNNERLQKMINERIQILENCKNEDIQNTAKQVNSILLNAYIANAGGWFIYLIPLAIAMGAFKTVTSFLSKLALAPAQEVHKIIPHTDNSAYC